MVMQYSVVGLKQTKTGIMILNKPDNNNNVTIECADELFRFFNTFAHDHTVENVWIDNKGVSFSGGADYDQLLNNSQYLDRLMRLSIKIGQFNKPIFAKVHGSARGLGAYLLPMFSTPLGTENSNMRLDETAKGFIPIFGGSHRLSRLPCNIGIYLALTGDTVDGQQMGTLGFLRGKVRDEFSNKQIHKHLSNANLWHRYHLSESSQTISEARRDNIVNYKKDFFHQFIKQAQKQIFNVGTDLNSQLALNQLRIAQTDYYNMLNPHNSFNVEDKNAGNYFQMRHNRAFRYLQQKGIVQEGRNDDNVLARLPVAKMIKCFNRESIAGVLEELDKDGSEWAQNTAKMIRKNDSLAVNLTFQLIKNARQLSWVECLEEEYKVAKRLLKISKTKEIVTNSGSTLKGLQNNFSNVKAEDIPKEKITQFFKPCENDDEIFDHDTPNHSFLPTSQYWRQTTDAGRNYLNRTFFEDYYAKFAQNQVKRFLHINKIDYRDSSFNIPTLRKYMYKKIWYDRMIQLEKQRIRGIFRSDKFYRSLKENRQNYLQEQIKSPKFGNVIAEEIKKYFEHKFNSRFEDMEKTAKIAGKQTRMEIIRNYVNTLTKNIVLNGRKIEDEDRESNIRHNGIVRFDQKNTDIFNVQTDYELKNPELNLLKKAYQNNEPQELEKIDKTIVKPVSMFQDRIVLQEEAATLKKEATLQKAYGKSIIARENSFKYQAIIKKTAKTSEEIAGLLGWENTDIESMIINSPKTETTFKEFAQQVFARAPKIEEQVQKLNQAYKAFIDVKQSELAPLVSQTVASNKTVEHVFFDDTIIPRSFRSVHLALYEEVVKFYSSKYTLKGAITNIPAEKHGDHITTLTSQWARQGVNSSFTRLMKNDVEYTFSYLVILHLKQMLVDFQRSNAKEAIDKINLLSKKYGVDFSGFTENQFNGVFMQYLYSTLDLHEDSKHKIIFPQTKLVEFLNCFKINSQPRNITFDTLLLLIAKDRKMIRDSAYGDIPLLGYTPEITLNILKNEQKKTSKIIPQEIQITEKTPKSFIKPLEHMLQLQTNVQANKQDDKKLVLSFSHYLRRFEAMLQQVGGNTMFLPKSLYKYEGKQTYQMAKDVLKIQMNEKQWFEQKMRLGIISLLDYRYQVQKNMSSGELRLFDQQFGELFTPEMIGLVIRYECYVQEFVAKRLVSDEKNQYSTNDQIKSLYLDMKSEIKNPRALKMLNNLILTQETVQSRISMFQEFETKKDTLMPTRQEFTELGLQQKKRINQRTAERLARDVFRYGDDQSGTTAQNIKVARIALGVIDSDIRKDEHFLKQLKEINDLLEDTELKMELDNRLTRMKVLKE